MNDPFDKMSDVERLIVQSNCVSCFPDSQLDFRALVGDVTPPGVDTMLCRSAMNLLGQSVQPFELPGMLEGMTPSSVDTTLGRSAMDLLGQSVQPFKFPGMLEVMTPSSVGTMLGGSAMDLLGRSVQPFEFHGIMEGTTPPRVDSMLGRTTTDLLGQVVHSFKLPGMPEGMTSPSVDSMLGRTTTDLLGQGVQQSKLSGMLEGMTSPSVDSMLGRSAMDLLGQSMSVQPEGHLFNPPGIVGGVTPSSFDTILGRTAMSSLVHSPKMESLLESIQSGVANDYLFGDLERERVLYQTNLDAALGSTSAGFLDMPKRIRDLTGQMESFHIAPGIRSVLGEAMLRIEDYLPALSHTSSAVIGLAMDSWKSIIEERSHIDALGAPLNESARMAASSLKLLSHASDDPGMRRAVELSLMLNDADLRASALNLAAIGLEHDGGLARPAEQPALYVPRFERIELRRRLELHDLELHEVVAELKIGDVVILSREITRLVIHVNDMRCMAGQGPIFKMTNRVAKVIANLTWMAVVDERTFADFIDALYWLLYEAPGAGSLRYLVDQGGVFSRDECDLVFIIKRLRNHYRHDPEHGSERDIERKFMGLRQDLQILGFSSLPRMRADFRRLQRALLSESCSFLRSLLERIDEGSLLP